MADGTPVRMMTHENIDMELERLRLEFDLKHSVFGKWPADPIDVAALHARASHVTPNRRRLVVLRQGFHGQQGAFIDWIGGTVEVVGLGTAPDDAAHALEWVRGLVPQAVSDDPEVVPITFWYMTHNGPQSIRRDADAQEWEEVKDNYALHATQPDLAPMMDGFAPGLGGQLLLWRGPAGTGKSTALRTLAREWRSWASFHYIVDPDQFFGEHASYMMQVLLGGEDKEQPDGPAAEQWRVIVLEDCGDLLRHDARADVGQALSRFLNACDGLIGRGLRILLLVTTNDDLGQLHPAVSRPGRCAVDVEFRSLSPVQARQWLDSYGCPGMAGELTLADLYARVEGSRQAKGREPVGFGV